MLTPEQIAKLLTEDPDIFNEMAVGTGAIAFGPAMNLPQKKRSKKRKIKREDDDDLQHQKKYYADPVTGQPKVKGDKDDDSGEILYSDTQSDGPEETIDEATDPEDILIKLIDTDINIPPLDQWAVGDELNDILRRRIITTFRKSFGVLKQMIERLPGGCKLTDEWENHLNYVTHLRKPDAQQVREPIEWEGNPIQTPPKGWWGQKWGVTSQRNYILIFFYEACAIYFEALQDLYDDHIDACNDPECTQSDHKRYLAQALCSDQVGFAEIWDRQRQERQKNFEEFRRGWNRRKPVRAKPLTDREKEALERYNKLSPGEQFKTSLLDVFPDTMKNLATWYKDYPKSKRSVFSSGFGEPTMKSGDQVTHYKYGKGRVASTPRELDLYVRVMFDKDLQSAFGQIGSGVEHNVKVRRVKKSDLDALDY